MNYKILPVVAFCLTLPLLAAPSAARASPWVLQEDTVVLSGRFDFQHADREFRDTADAEAFPLSGEFQSTTFVTSLRLGLVERFELEMSIPLRSVSYTSNPVILLPGDDTQGIDYYQENTIDLSEQTFGVADIRMAGRYQFLEGPVVSAVELSVKTPTGYEGPSGTFGDSPKDAEDFKANVGRYVQPGNVEDDVTLGDAQLDLGADILVGWSFPTRTFLRLDAGYRLRLGGAGDQIVGNFQIGQSLSRRVFIKAGTRIGYSVQDGDVIGVSVAAEDPSLPAEDYGGLENLKLREVPLEHDRLSINAGISVRVTDDVDTLLSYSRVLWGRNTALTQTVSLGVGVAFDIGGRGGSGS